MMMTRRLFPSRAMRRKRYIPSRYFIMFLIVSLLCINMVRNMIMMPRFTSGPSLSNLLERKHRIAILIPFLSNSVSLLPPYFPIFLRTAKGSSSLVDFLIFHNGQLTPLLTTQDENGPLLIQGYPIPENVKFIDLQSMERMVGDYFLRVVDDHRLVNAKKKETLKKILCHFLLNNPYGLVEFKPALGYIFQKFIPTHTYTHWGYTDLDIAFGDLPRWITRDELENFDIVTYSYGDQHRVYLRGQFTFHRNTEMVNELWKKCAYLSKMDHRFAAVASGKERFHLQSAEGCYSNVVIRTPHIRVKYAVKAWTDAKEHNYERYDYGIAISTGRENDKSILYKPSAQSLSQRHDVGNEFLHLSSKLFDENGPRDEYSKRGKLQWETGEMIPLPASNDTSGCMFWVRPEYQTNLCLDDDLVSPTDTVFLIDGTLYKQTFQERDFHKHSVTSKAFFHFQEWKRDFRSSQLLALLPPDDRSFDTNSRNDQEKNKQTGWMLFPEGSIPLLSNIEDTEMEQSNVMQEYQTTNSFKLPLTRYCLVASGKKTHSSTECDYTSSWRDQNVMTLVSEDWYRVKEVDVTLVLTLALPLSRRDTKLVMDVLETNFINWNYGPVVILIHEPRSLKNKKDYIVKRVKRMIRTRRSMFLIGIIKDEKLEQQSVTWTGLLNMAESASRSRWTISGLNLERGLILSLESSFMAQQTASLYADQRGSVFLLPQIAFMNDMEMASRTLPQNTTPNSKIHSPSIIDLLDTDENDVTFNLAETECTPCEGSHHEKEFDKVLYRVWQKLSEQSMSTTPILEEDMGVIINDIHQLGAELTSLLLNEHTMELIQFDKHPLVMIDANGPVGGISTSTSQIVSEIVDFDEKCTNALRLARLSLLKYTIMPLPGAFAISTPRSRVACSSTPTSAARKKCVKYKQGKCFKNIVMNEIILSARFAWMTNKI